MKQFNYKLKFTGVVGILGFTSFFLLGCMSSASKLNAEQTAIANTQTSPYPGLVTPVIILEATPTYAHNSGLRYNGLLVTPLPQERIQVADVEEMAGFPVAVIPSRPRYTAQTIIKGEGANTNSFVLVSEAQTGKEIVRLGDETSQSILKTMNDDYVIWVCGACTTQKFGLYAYHLLTGKQIFISEIAGQYPKIDGDWVVYISDLFLPTGVELRAYNLATGEEILITQAMATRQNSLQGPASAGDFFAVGNSQIVWVSDLSNTKHTPLYWGFSLFDLKTRITRNVELPQSVGDFSALNIFGNIIVWQQSFWQGYDLQQNEYFSIPIIPTGWESKPIDKTSAVIVHNGQLYWSLWINGKEHYFTASLALKNK